MGAYSGDSNSDKYEYNLGRALDFIEDCLYLEDCEGNTRSKWAVAQCLRAINVEIPFVTHEEYMYLEPCYEDDVEYWPDRLQYAHLWELRHRIRDEY